MTTRKCTPCGKLYPLTKEYFRIFTGRTIPFKSYCKLCASSSESFYRNTEIGFLNQLFNSWYGRVFRKKNYIHSNLYHELTTKKMMLEHWEEHKKQYGYRCFYTKKMMTYIGSNRRGKRTLTNISIDRIDNTKGYTKENTVFCRWDFNNKKGSVTFDMCKTILKAGEQKQQHI